MTVVARATTAVAHHTLRSKRRVNNETRAMTAVDVPIGRTTATPAAIRVIASGARCRRPRLATTSSAARKVSTLRLGSSAAPSSEKTSVVVEAKPQSTIKSAVRQIGGRRMGAR